MTAPARAMKPKTRVLVVEDEGIVAAAIADHLTAHGYEVAGVTGTGESAIAIAGELKPDVVLMDIKLGGLMSGIEAATRLRTSEMPVIFLTAYSSPELLAQAQLADPAGYIIKPYAIDNLLHSIEQAIGNEPRESIMAAAATKNSTDHDLLVRLDTKLDLVNLQLNEARTAVAGKADAAHIEPRFVKIETRLDGALKTIYMILGGLAVVEIALKFFIK